MTFHFATATQIHFGAGALREAGSIARRFGRRALIVTGKTVERARPLLELLDACGVSSITFPVAGEPTLSKIVGGSQLCRMEQCDFVIGFGGGSAIDAGKAISALTTNDGELLDYLEVVGAGKPLEQPTLPFIAIPTTTGTGAEVTRNAVLSSPEHRVKVSLRSSLMLPKFALVDPVLTYDLPSDLTASTGLDALTQLVEAYVSCRANPLTDAICVEGIRRAAKSLRGACDNGADPTAREDMALASLFGGLALANAGLGAVHGFAAAIGGMFTAPHGAVCAALLPHVMQANIVALRERDRDAAFLHRYDEVARLLAGSPTAGDSEGVAWVEQLCAHLKIPSLQCYGITRNDFLEVIEKASQSSSMRANPIVLNEGEMEQILQRAL